MKKRDFLDRLPTTSRKAILLSSGIAALFLAFSGSVPQAQADCGEAPGRAIDWQDCRKNGLMLNGLDLANSNFSKTNLSSSDLRNTRLIGSNFSKANLVRASLAGANASDTIFAGAIASRTSFKGGIFKDANFFKAEMTRVDFSEASLENVNFSKGQASRASFAGAVLNMVNFDFTSMARSDLRGVKIEGPVSMDSTFLFRARVEGVDLSKVKGMKNWQLELACGDDNTKIPDGLSRPTNWPCSDESDD